MYENFYALILAGGGGTRLWPLSRKALPKQMLRLIDERSMFQMAVQRLNGLFPEGRILVVTSAHQAVEMQDQCPQIPEENFIIEPGPRGTASAIGLSAVTLLKRDPQAVMAVLTADHFIQEVGHFLGLLKAAYQVAREGYLVTMGITPTYPATGYGYIKVGREIGEFEGIQAYAVDQFKEKPILRDARAMIKDGKYLWNSGMFIWEVQQVLDEFERQLPEHFSGISRISDSLGTTSQDAITSEIWSNMKPKTIDYGIMEDAKRTAIIPAEGLGWSDIGSWESFFDVMQVDENGNIIRGGESISMDTRNSLFYLYGSERLVVTIGVEDLVVVDTGDVLLLCSRDKAQDVRKVIKVLKHKELDDYL